MVEGHKVGGISLGGWGVCVGGLKGVGWGGGHFLYLSVLNTVSEGKADGAL